MKRIVGIDANTYREIRNFAGLPFSRYEVQKKRELYKLLNAISFRLFNRTPQILLNSWNDFGLVKADVFHFFNGISYGRTPWVSTFETYLPRWGEVSDAKLQKGFRLLAGEPCAKLIALSECTRRIQEDFTREHSPASADAIMGKTVVLHPVQERLVASLDEKPMQEKDIHFLFVGIDFFRKGGLEMLRVFDRLIAGGAEIRLTIISKMAGGDYASQAGEKEKAEAVALIAKHPQRITHHTQLPNTEVLKLMKSAHVGLLPTWADTYGYSVLENQAAGCPSISTDVRALPEINPEACGWMIEVPKDKWGNALTANTAQRKELSEIISQGLEKTIRNILDNPAQIREKGAKALERISKEHDPKQRAAELEAIYDAAIEGR